MGRFFRINNKPNVQKWTRALAICGLLSVSLAAWGQKPPTLSALSGTCTNYEAPAAGTLHPNRSAASQSYRAAIARNSDILAQLPTYQRSTGAQHASAEDKLRGILNERKAELLDTMHQNPELALKLILTADQSQSLAPIGDNCLEKTATVRGQLTVVHGDFTDGSDGVAYSLKTATNTLNLYIANADNTRLLSGSTIEAFGALVDTQMLVNAANGLTILDSGPSATTPTGAQNTAVIMANFSNATSALSKAQIDDYVFNQANNYHKENSYQKISITGASYGYYSLAMGKTCDTTAIENAAISAADPDINYNQYSHVIVVAPIGTSCGWSGWSSIGSRQVSTADGQVTMSVADVVAEEASLYSFGHEFGHGIGIDHASFVNCGAASLSVDTSTCTDDEYGDKYDIMGPWGSNGQMNAAHKDYLGFFAPGNIQTVTANGTYTLEPIEQPSANLKAIKISRGSGDYLYVEYRQPLGYDSSFSSISGNDVFQGALVHILKTSIKTRLIDTSPPGEEVTVALKVGQTFTDPFTNTQITVTSRTSSGLTLSVNVGKTDFTNPTVTFLTPAPSAPVTGTITLSSNASDSESGVARVEYTCSTCAAPIGSSTSAPYAVSFDTTTVPNGSVKFYATVYDKAGNSGSNFRAVQVLNP